MPLIAPRDRVLLHLLDARGHRLAERPSPQMTQEGISTALGMNRTHITRVLKPLLDDEQVESKKGHVTGRDRKLTYYALTESGFARATDILRSFGEENVELIDPSGSRRNTKVRDALKQYPEIGRLALVDALHEGRPLKAPGERLVQTNAIIDEVEQFERGRQIDQAKAFLGSPSTLMVIIASYGYGSSSLLKHTALELWRGPLFWFDLEADGSAQSVKDSLDRFAKRLDCADWMSLADREALLCFDNYHVVEDPLVDLLIELVKNLRSGKTKIAVAMRGETPSYNRFYQRHDVQDGTAIEIPLSRFEEATVRKMLGDDIDDEAFQLIYMLTRGQPLALALLKTGDVDGLKKIRLSEEVRFLMYLRDRKKTSKSTKVQSPR
jgi:DNA-binding MarR family transcriptional regulator